MEAVEIITLSMQVAKAEHRQKAGQIATFNDPDLLSVFKTDFKEVLTNYQSNPFTSLDQQIESSSKQVLKQSTSIDQLTAEVLDASGRYKTLTEVLNRNLGLMNIAVSGKSR
jgi:hypothetical protein